MEQASRAAARGTEVLGQLDVFAIIGNTVLVNSGFHTRKLFPLNYP